MIRPLRGDRAERTDPWSHDDGDTDGHSAHELHELRRRRSDHHHRLRGQAVLGDLSGVRRIGSEVSGQPCGNCGGKGTVLVPLQVPKDDGTYDTWWNAQTCPACGGKGTV